MGKRLYETFDVDEETPVQYVAVHPLRWRPEWGEPAIMFRELGDTEQAMADAAPAMYEALKAVEWVEDTDGERYCPWCSNNVIYGHSKTCQGRAALAAAEGKEEE